MSKKDYAVEIQRLVSLIESKDESVQLYDVDSKRKSSSVWQHVERIYENDERTDFVRCNSCLKIFVNSKTSGTSTLNHHINSCLNKIETDGGATTDGGELDPNKPRKSKRKRKRRVIIPDDESDFSDGDSKFSNMFKSNNSRGSGTATRREAINMFTELVENLGGSSSKTFREKKSFASYTDDDFAREERELNIRERRVRIRQAEAQTEMFRAQEEFYDTMRVQIPTLLEPIAQAAQVFVSNQAPSSSSTGENSNERGEPIVARILTCQLNGNDQ